jgi:hypothetical protein
MDSNQLIECKNCGNKFHGNYCNVCSQSAKSGKITWKDLLHDLPHAIFHADKGLLHTIKELLVKPGHTISDYINGKRVSHFNPLLFLVIMGGFLSFFYTSFKIELPNEEVNLEKIERINITLGHEYFVLIGLVFIILFSLTDYFFYKSKKFTMPEVFISNFFQAGQIMLITLAMVPVFVLQTRILHQDGLNFELRFLLKCLYLLFLFYTRFQLYDAKRDLKKILTILFQIALVFSFYQFVVLRILIYMES